MNTRSLNKEAQKNNNNNNPNIKPKTTKQCRICYGDDSTEDNPLIYPCICKNTTTMTKAEERAFETYPKYLSDIVYTGDGKTWEQFDCNATKREGYVKGYEQAEKDLALTPEDVSKIFNKVRELQVKYPATEACFEEVAEWFNNLKEEKK